MFKRFYEELPPSAGVEEAASLFGARFPDSVRPLRFCSCPFPTPEHKCFIVRQGEISMAMLQGFLQACRGEDGMACALAGIAQLGRGDPIEQLAVIGKEDLPVNEYSLR